MLQVRTDQSGWCGRLGIESSRYTLLGSKHTLLDFRILRSGERLEEL